MSTKAIYQFFDADGQDVVATQSDRRSLFWDLDNERDLKNEALAAFFKIASAVLDGKVERDRTDRIDGVKINDIAVNFSDLKSYIAQSDFSIGNRPLEMYEKKKINPVKVIKNVFPTLIVE